MYIDSYKKGGLFLYSLVLQFQSSVDKDMFIDKYYNFTTGSVDHNIMDIFNSIENMYFNGIRGKLNVVAFQNGGDVSQLSKLFHSNETRPQMLRTSCTFEDISDCSEIVGGLNTYTH